MPREPRYNILFEPVKIGPVTAPNRFHRVPQTYQTLEQGHIQTRLLELGITIEPHRAVTEIHGDGVGRSCIFTGRKSRIACEAVVLVTARLPNEAVYRELLEQREAWVETGILSVKAMGDAFAPRIIAAAGHRYARELDGAEAGDDTPFKRELTELGPLREGVLS